MFQEKNAETTLLEAEKRIAAAKQQYAAAQNLLAQQTAIGQWEKAIEQFAQIPPETLAGRLAPQKLDVAQNEFIAVIGQSSTLQSQGEIGAAAQFARRAAEASQNPPHPVEEWQRVESLWQDAIARLASVSKEDEVGYQQAQAKLAEYKDNLAQIGIRKKQEADSVAAFQRAQSLTNFLLGNPPSNNRSLTASLREIIATLKQVESGTTAYPEAQSLLQDAQQKLNKISPNSKN